jgi:hypothetical protein
LQGRRWHWLTKKNTGVHTVCAEHSVVLPQNCAHAPDDASTDKTPTKHKNRKTRAILIMVAPLTMTASIISQGSIGEQIAGEP